MNIKIYVFYYYKIQAETKMDSKQRQQIIEQFQTLIKSKSIATKIEKGIYNYATEETIGKYTEQLFKRIYADKCITLHNNLNPKIKSIDNKNLLKELTKKKSAINPERLAFMSPKDLFPDNWKVLEAKMAEEDDLKHADMTVKTDQFTCPRCKKNKTSFYEKQVRSADEASTTFITCLECGYKWRMN